VTTFRRMTLGESERNCEADRSSPDRWLAAVIGIGGRGSYAYCSLMRGVELRVRYLQKLYLTLPGVNARGFFTLRANLLRQDCSSLSRGRLS